MKMNINNFRRNLDWSVLRRGVQYLNMGRVKSIMHGNEGDFSAKVQGGKLYDVQFCVDGKGKITKLYCSCPYWKDYGEPCKHIAAALMKAEKEIKGEMSEGSSEETADLISSYREMNRFFSDSSENGEQVRIVPELESGRELRTALKIGRDKLYKVKSIPKLYNDFKAENTVRYGKGLELCHRTDILDERSRQLLELAARSCLAESYYSRYDSSAPLDGMVFDSFFELFRDEYVSMEGTSCLVKFEEPKVRFTVGVTENSRFKLTCDGFYKLLGKGGRSCFFDSMNNVLFIASKEFTRAVYRLYSILKRETAVFISKEDMPSFYNAVLRTVSGYAEIIGTELIEDFIPPELQTQLYIDCGEDGSIFGKLLFAYGDEIFPAFSEKFAVTPAVTALAPGIRKKKSAPLKKITAVDPIKKRNPHYDEAGEKAAAEAVLNFFELNAFDEHHPLVMKGDEKIYGFVTKGISALSKSMELFVSERFRRIAVRPPIRPVVKAGLRPGGGVLDMKIEDENYSPEELAEVLKAYRGGAKFHRLSDGSFVLPGESAAEFSEIMDNLDISVKDIIKSNIKIPAYRMLYLDSLKGNSSIRMRPDAEFKSTVKKYRDSMGNSENLPVPEGFKGEMRDYQEYGFRWMSTVSAYGFGGILADDMGLGKTVQAIALMLWEKERGGGHKTNLIVCPSSLTLNWESEIKRFAPSLSVIAVIGAAAVRAGIIEEIPEGGYDAVITSYAALARDIDKYENIKFHLHFIDEAQYIKNHSTQSAKAVKGICSGHRFALTGTPVENSLAELWSIFDFVMPGYLFGYSRFRKNFETPIVSKGDERAVNALRKNVSPFILRRMKRDVLEELPEKTETTLVSSMEGEQKKLYTANAAQVKKSVREGLGDNPADRIQILAMLTRLRQLCCDPGLVYENYGGGSAKLEQCMELIESCTGAGHKLLLFSQFTSMLDIIGKRLESGGISYYLLTGSTGARERIRMVNEFNGNDVSVFLISLKAGGTGLNLTGADIVIHFDPWWNVSAQDQASDRVYRIGQKRNVQVYKLIAGGTLEENILKLQEEKAKLGDIVSGGGDITKMSAEEIIGLLG